ncbi:c-type cytochrome [Ferruginibacter sp. HRS2-29]|uniref:c-type cytochrome n=1 Tax=Ferruginibacter sp. HRS2-29 TaxID=2487334 RepID=UPI0020CC37A8|nr:c-type cytochrome [Ferruginibacter sp. HRS2-29]MCP9750353.1 c-type cytochrome [Ferruginibacter sp. HRS2-29]
MRISKIFLTASLLLTATIVTVAAIPQDEFKNLQVLPKNISAKELDKIMEGFNEGLGVGCNYCHTKNVTTKDLEFDKDSKPEKEMARKMMLLTNDINKKYFPESKDIQAVTCYTCHHGNPMPATDSADFRRKSDY